MSENGQRGWVWAQSALAVIAAILFLGMALPNTGRVVIEHAATEPTFEIVGRAHDSLMLITAVLFPLALIFLGARRRSLLAILGWILLLVLLVIAFLK